MDAGARKRVLTVLVAGLAMWGSAEAFTRHYILCFDDQDRPCLPWRVYLIERTSLQHLERWQIAAFRAKDIAHYRDGKLFAKFLAGVPGDHFKVTPQQTSVANIHWGPINLDYAKALQHEPRDFARDQVIPPGKAAMLTGAPNSYDSRYWGVIDQSQIVGRAIPLW